MTIAYPLTWPDTMPRSPSREAGAFRTELPAALKNVATALEAFGRDSGKPVSEIVLSSNVSLGQNKPADPGIAAWFKWEGQQICIAVDRYSTPAANLQAIFHIIEARRTELRHGTLNLVRATFQGFKALPAPPGSHWTEILGLPMTATAAQIRAAYTAKAKTAHPDQGGTQEAMAALTDARDRALKQARP